MDDFLVKEQRDVKYTTNIGELKEHSAQSVITGIGKLYRPCDSLL